MKKTSIVGSLVALLCMCIGCDLINPDEKIPTYVQIDSFGFVAYGDTLGATSHKLRSVWAYWNNEPLGAFELPATIPVLAEQRGVLTVAPGIDFNGMKSFQAPYPFYKFDSLMLDPQPGKVVHFYAKTGYAKGAKMVYNSTFDLGNPFFRYNGDTTIMRTTDPEYVLEGGGAGLIYLDGPNKSSQNIAMDDFTPSFGSSLFLELDYKCTIPFQVGIAAFYNNGNESLEYAAGINPHPSGWNKMYISIQEVVGAHQGAQLHLVIRAGTDNGQSSGWVAVDNIKILSF